MPKRALKHAKRGYHWWQSLPGWLRFSKTLVIIGLMVSVPALDRLAHWQEYRSIYNEYYAHFHASYIHSQDPSYAHYLADYYADFYANYYSSPKYRLTLNYALPVPTAQTKSYPTTSVIAELSISAQGLSLLREFEGLRLEPYADAGGKLTIGYGHLIRPGEFFGKLSEKEADALLREDLLVAEAFVKRYVHVELTPQQFSALVSLVYNIGPNHFRNSTLLRALNRHDYARAAQEFLRWNKIGKKEIAGLSRRRAAEKRLFES